jgi:apolipoprotein D and lipocalin family protein
MHVLALCAIFFASLANASSSRELPTVPDLDLKRYMGVWYEVARLPNRFQTQCVGNVSAQYEQISEKKIRVTNRCKKENGEYTEAIGRARKADGSGLNSKLKVSFAPWWVNWLCFVWGNYWVLELADDYSYAVVGEPSLSYLWVLSRSKSMPAATLDGILERAQKMGYDTSKIIKTPQD